MNDHARTMTAARADAVDAAPREPDGQGQALSLCQEGGLLFAGRHLLIELWGANHLTSEPDIRRILQDAVAACRATLLSIDLHTFSPTHGISGVAVLGESHMSIHTWPEHAYAAVDIFMCGSLDPRKAIPVLKRGFQPKQVQIMEVKRGVMDADALVR
ncbi:MAG: S-adenosylmethionine decarboxylase proenzyme [Omnitrophica WOR_2 bacterium RIFCSPHIGHO2_02_FULL_68_15]|nr:MAG: S-adenosylmethionine decarboxylase proenzyme [Omnitrophica WOR_2 bacterium RIFCSPHIGHO2_02_FULL_68_15]